MNKQLLFVHIPKTAGTSFRLAAQKYFTLEHTFLDYSPSSIETSKEILEYFYTFQDLYALGKALQIHEEFFLAGHFPVGKYMALFDTLNVITFVREPVRQVLSHYKHYCRDLGYAEDFHTFIREKRFKNFQSRLLGAKPLELFGFIGLTEEYSLSVAMINDYYHCDFEVLEENVSAKKGSIEIELDKETIALIRKENKEDMEMYKKAKDIFNKRVISFREKKPYIHMYIQEKTELQIRGCAFSKYSLKPVELDLYINQKNVKLLTAKSWRPGLIAHGVPRGGFVGFEYSLKALSDKEKESIVLKSSMHPQQ